MRTKNKKVPVEVYGITLHIDAEKFARDVKKLLVDIEKLKKSPIYISTKKIKKRLPKNAISKQK